MKGINCREVTAVDHDVVGGVVHPLVLGMRIDFSLFLPSPCCIFIEVPVMLPRVGVPQETVGEMARSNDLVVERRNY